MKKCSKCKQEKPFTEFYKGKKPDGYQNECKTCGKERYKKYYPKNKKTYLAKFFEGGSVTIAKTTYISNPISTLIKLFAQTHHPESVQRINKRCTHAPPWIGALARDR